MVLWGISDAGLRGKANGAGVRLKREKKRFAKVFRRPEAAHA
jgi:hypothetical protein